MTIEEKENILMAKKDKIEKIEIEKFTTGNTVLDCILSNGPEEEKGYPKGRIVWLHGGSSSGKTSICTEATYNLLKTYGKENSDYLFLDYESGYSINTEEMYGFSLMDGEHRVCPSTIEEGQVLISNFFDKKDPNRPKIIILDSLDSASCGADVDNLKTRKNEYNKTGQISDIKSYNMSKAKFISEFLRGVVSELEANNAILFIVSQLRDNVNAGLYGPKSTTSGGRGPEFYSSVIFSLRGADTFGEKNREWGACVEVKAVKSRSPFQNRIAYLNVDFEQGLDNISSNVDFLYDLKDDRGKLNETKCNSLKWEDSFDVNNLDAEAVSDAEVKSFAEEEGIEDAVREKFKRLSAKNVQKYLSEDVDLRDKFIKKFHVMDRDMLISWIEEDVSGEREEELNRRTSEKFYHLEYNSRPKRKKRKVL